jgi:hypothetical protein
MALLSFVIASATRDKDPSFSAKQARVKDEHVWAEIRECPLLADTVL